MSRVMAFSTLAICLFLSQCATAAAREVPTAELIAGAPDASAHPGKSGVFLLKSRRLAVDENFGTTLEVRRVVKILNPQGAKDFGQVGIGYELGEETVEIVKAVTYDGDKIIPAPAEGITDITPSDESDSNSYSNRRIKVISMPALKPGVVVEVVHRVRRSKPRFAGKFQDGFDLQGLMPQQTVRYTLVVPKGMSFRHFVSGTKCAPQATPDGDRTAYRWELKDVPGIVPEPGMPADVAPYLLVSNWSSWREVGDFNAALLKPSLEVTDSVRQFVAAATKGKKTPQKKLEALYTAVATQIRYVALGFGGAEGYRPHAAAETLEKRYGCCRDKAALLVAALAEVGIKSHYVLINASSPNVIQAHTPGLFFDHAIVAVPMEDGYLWLDPTNDMFRFGNLPPHNQNRMALIVHPGASRLVRTPLASADKNALSVAFDCELTADGRLHGTCTWKCGGFWDALFRDALRRTSATRRVPWLADRIRAFTNNSMTIRDATFSDADDFSVPLTMTFKFECQGYVTEIGDMLTVKLPELLVFEPNVGQMTAADKRRYAAELGFATSVVTTVTLRLSEGYSVSALPKGMKYSNAVGGCDSSYAFAGSRFEMRRRFAVSLARIPASNYSHFRELFGFRMKEIRKQLVLKRKGG